MKLIHNIYGLWLSSAIFENGYCSDFNLKIRFNLGSGLFIMNDFQLYTACR